MQAVKTPTDAIAGHFGMNGDVVPKQRLAKRGLDAWPDDGERLESDGRSCKRRKPEVEKAEVVKDGLKREFDSPGFTKLQAFVGSFPAPRQSNQDSRKSDHGLGPAAGSECVLQAGGISPFSGQSHRGVAATGDHVSTGCGFKGSDRSCRTSSSGSPHRRDGKSVPGSKTSDSDRLAACRTVWSEKERQIYKEQHVKHYSSGLTSGKQSAGKGVDDSRPLHVEPLPRSDLCTSQEDGLRGHCAVAKKEIECGLDTGHSSRTVGKTVAEKGQLSNSDSGDRVTRSDRASIPVPALFECGGTPKLLQSSLVSPSVTGAHQQIKTATELWSSSKETARETAMEQNGQTAALPSHVDSVARVGVTPAATTALGPLESPQVSHVCRVPDKLSDSSPARCRLEPQTLTESVSQSNDISGGSFSNQPLGSPVTVAERQLSQEPESQARRSVVEKRSGESEMSEHKSICDVKTTGQIQEAAVQHNSKRNAASLAPSDRRDGAMPEARFLSKHNTIPANGIVKSENHPQNSLDPKLREAKETERWKRNCWHDDGSRRSFPLAAESGTTPLQKSVPNDTKFKCSSVGASLVSGSGSTGSSVGKQSSTHGAKKGKHSNYCTDGKKLTAVPLSSGNGLRKKKKVPTATLR